MNEFSSSMASVVIFLATGRKFNFSKYIFDSLVRNVDSSSKFYMYPRFLQLMINDQVGDLSSHTSKYTSPTITQKVFANMIRVGKGFFRVDTPLFEGMLVQQHVHDDVANNVADDVADSRMGYEKPSTKLTFYKAFFLAQWSLVRNVDSSSKFYMYPRFLQLMINDQVGDLSSHTSKYTSPTITQKVFANMIRVGKGFFRVDTPLFEGMLVQQHVHDDVANNVADDVADSEKGVLLQAEQYDWLEDTDEEIDEQELEAHYNYMAKIQEVPNANTCTDSEPLEQVQNDTGYNVFANDL
nr:hypothetical protein [Tanacetum cinerariifolium]